MRKHRSGEQIGMGLLLIAIFLMSSGMAIESTNNADFQPERIDDLETTMKEAASDVSILFIMDHDYGANYHFIRPIFEGWGWTVTIAGTSDTLTPCTYQSSVTTVDSDILLSDIDDVTEYDCISIMPGSSHALLLGDATTRNLIRTAVEEEMVVAAWCRAVRVLADADVIDGLNVTGNADYVGEYAAAGATYLGVVPPVIQGNIVTGVRSRFYRQAMCEAISTAVGVFEEDAPEVSDVTLASSTISPDNWTILSATITDLTGISSAKAEIFTTDANGVRNSTSPVFELDMISQQGDIYAANISNLPEGWYSIDICAEDMFENSITCTNVANLAVALSLNPLTIDPMTIIVVGTAICAVLVVAMLVKIQKP